MNPTRLAIAAGVLALLGGAVWWSNKEEAKKEGQPAPGASPDIVAIKDADIKEIEIKKGTDISTTLKKDDAGKWSITAPEALAADAGAVANLTSAVTKMASERVVDENVAAAELGNYGLSPAAVSATFTLAGGTKKTILVGADNPTGNAVYVKVEGDNRLFTAQSSVKTSLSKDSKDLRERHIVVFETDKVSRFELDRSKGAVEFSKIADSEWQFIKPKAARADGFQVEDLVRKMHELQMDATVDPKAAASGFAGASPVASVKITTPGGVESAEIRKQKDDLFAKVKSGTYQLHKDSVIGLADALSKATDDLRNKKVFDFGFSDPTKIEVKDGAKTSAYEKSGEKWTSGGKNYDTVSIQSLVDKLRDMSATKFAESGFTSSAIEVTVVSNAGKRTEKVQIAANGLAKREGDSTLYQLAANAVDDIRSAANGIQPEQATAATESKKK